MKTNPGGQLAVDEIIGRELISQTIRDILKTQSVIMTAERRIGKTSIMTILEEKPEKNWIPIYSDLEKIRTAQEFSNLIYSIVQQHLSKTQQAKNLAIKLGEYIGGAEASGYKLPETPIKTWQDILEHSIATLAEEQAESGKQVLFLWDEVPYMLSNIRDEDGESTAMQVLDTLRSLRKDYKNFRLLITGSIGLHHVLNELKENGYRNEPVNDMYQVEITPLEHEDACYLAGKLFEGEKIQVDDYDAVAQAVAEETDNFPFYIHHIVKTLKLRQQIQNKEVTVESVEKVIKEKLVDDDDPWELRHYDDRIEEYYVDNAALVRLALDELALHDGLTPKALLDKIKNQSDFDDIEKLRKLLIQMYQDHYLSKNIKSQYEFRFHLIQRWWKIYREL
jgi:hypothetical protein